jgi:hypothetical protein
MSDDLLLASACFTIICAVKKQNRKKSMWVRTLYKQREVCSGLKIMRDLANDTEGFKKIDAILLIASFFFIRFL